MKKIFSKHKLAVTILIVILLMTFFYFLCFLKKDPSQNQNNNNTIDDNNQCVLVNEGEANRDVEQIEKHRTSYVSTTKSIMGKSTQGGTQINYSMNGKVVIVEQVFYGETGKSEASYYFKNGKVFYSRKKNIQYEGSIYDDNFNPDKVKSIEVKDFYLDLKENLCIWYENHQRQLIDNDTRDLVRYLISGLE